MKVQAIKERIVANFDMRGQYVNNQYNAGGDINFGTIQATIDLITELEKLRSQIAQAKVSRIVPEETATDAEYEITEAIQQAKKTSPDRKTLLDHLARAKILIEDITAASGLVTALVGAIQVVQKLFS